MVPITGWGIDPNAMLFVFTAIPTSSAANATFAKLPKGGFIGDSVGSVTGIAKGVTEFRLWSYVPA